MPNPYTAPYQLTYNLNSMKNNNYLLIVPIDPNSGYDGTPESELKRYKWFETLEDATNKAGQLILKSEGQIESIPIWSIDKSVTIKPAEVVIKEERAQAMTGEQLDAYLKTLPD